jgi:hypothetical protein
MKTSLLLAFAFATVVSAPVLAQGAGATLRIESGSAMVSTGGEFTTASSGAQLPSGARVMLAEGSRATLVYPNGCSQPMRAAGVYGVPATCVAAGSGASAAAATTAGVDVAAAGIIAGAAVLGATGLSTMEDVPAPPVSR